YAYTHKNHRALSILTYNTQKTEDTQQPIKAMTNHLNAHNYEKIIDRRHAIFRAIELADADDVVLIAGKGHETEQEIKGKVFEFDDRQVAKDAIRMKGM